jgi:hypothetical protein
MFIPIIEQLSIRNTSTMIGKTFEDLIYNCLK